jgi:sulfofructose kinase
MPEPVVTPPPFAHPRAAPPLVIVLGSVVVDHTWMVEDIPQRPTKATARTYSMGVGGLAANAAIAVARLGGRAVFWGRVGDDAAGPDVAAELAAEGIDVSGLHRCPGGRTAVSAVLVDKMGERATLSFRGAGLDPDPSWLPLERLGEASALLCDPRWPQASALVLEAARRLGLPSVIDAERSETRLLHQLVPLVDHAIFSVPGLQNFAAGVRPAEGLRRALAMGTRRVAAVTRGEDSVLWLVVGEKRVRETPAFKVEARNTTGAGDVFHGAYALAIAEGKDIAEAMRFAAAAGALRAEEGRTPTRAAVDALLTRGQLAASAGSP